MINESLCSHIGRRILLDKCILGTSLSQARSVSIVTRHCNHATSQKTADNKINIRENYKFAFQKCVASIISKFEDSTNSQVKQVFYYDTKFEAIYYCSESPVATVMAG